jgi:hypothetical protein
MMLRVRWFAKKWAAIAGYFWLPCPICHEPFAGFECGDEPLWDTITRGRCVCSKRECQNETRLLNAQREPRLVRHS